MFILYIIIMNSLEDTEILKKLMLRYGGEVTEAMIQEDCGDVLDVVKDLDSSLSEDNQVYIITTKITSLTIRNSAFLDHFTRTVRG